VAVSLCVLAPKVAPIVCQVAVVRLVAFCNATLDAPRQFNVTELPVRLALNRRQRFLPLSARREWRFRMRPDHGQRLRYGNIDFMRVNTAEIAFIE
jgi:hypothetical protein